MASGQQGGQACAAEDTGDIEMTSLFEDVEVMIYPTGSDKAVKIKHLTMNEKAKLKFFVEHKKDMLQEYLQEQGITLTDQDVCPGRTQLAFSSANNKTSDCDFIEQILEDWVISRLHVREVIKGTDEERKMLRNLKSKRPIAIKHKLAAVLSSDSHGKYFVVYTSELPKPELLFNDLGITYRKSYEHAPLSNAAQGKKDSLELKGQKETVQVTFNNKMILIHLDFRQHVHGTYGDWYVEFLSDSVVITKISNPTASAKQAIQSFLKRVHKEPLEFKHEFCNSLLFEAENTPNECLYAYVKRGLNNKNIDFYLGIENEKFFAYCRDESHVRQVAMFVRENIVYFTSQVIDETVLPFLEKWRGKKVRYEMLDGRYIICCTSDLSDEIENMLGEDVPCPHLMLEFLKKFGEEIKQEMQKLFNLRIGKFTKNSIWIVGEKKNLKECKRFLKNKILKKSVSINVSEECLRSKYEDLEKNIMENHCCWELLRHPDHCLDNCTYIASWLDPIGKLKITMIEGIPSKIAFDLHIVLSNGCLFPLENFEKGDEEWTDFLEKGRALLRENNKFKLGEHVFMLDGTSKLKSFQAAALVVCQEMYHKREVINETVFQEAVKKVLLKAEEKAVHRVGVTGSVTDNIIQSELIVKSVVLAAVDYAQRRNCHNVQELFICTEGDSQRIESCINSIFKKKRGYGKLKHIGRLPPLQRVSTIKVKVKVEVLTGVKADVIVNTARRDLKLNYGNVSESILKKAGKELQDECNEKYPDGIQPGDVAITSSQGLKDAKFIFHIALQDKTNNLDTCLQRLKSLLKTCLYHTERNGCKSIAFPALGVGKLKYPRREAAAAMFEAVEEFSFECLNPKLEKVYFVVYGDELTNKAFCNEEWRGSKICAKELGADCSRYNAFEDVPFCLHIKTDNLRVKITTQELVKLRLPSYVVNVIFETSSVQDSFKSATQDPKTWSDTLYLGDPKSDLQSLLKGFETLPKDERITTVNLNTIKGSHLSEGMQVKQIVDYLDTFALEPSSNLQKVFVIVKDEAGAQNALLHLQQETDKDKPWIVTSEEENKVYSTIELIGTSEVLLQKTETYIKSVLTEIHTPLAENMYEDLRSLGASAKEESMLASADEDSRDMEISDYGADTCTVSAELNPGIVKIKASMWKTWKIEMEMKFKLTFNETETCTTVIGTLEDILAFESDLENQFLSDDTAPESRSSQDDESLSMDEEFYSIPEEEKDICISMSESEYIAFQANYHENLAQMGSSGQYEKDIKCLVLKCGNALRSKVENELKMMLSEIRQKNQQLDVIDKSETIYSFNCLKIFVKKGDLLKENVNCILLSGHPRLNQPLHGLLGHVASHAGQKFKAELIRVRTLELNKCSLIPASGLGGSIQTVALVTFHPQNIDRVLFDALNTIDNADNYSVALPFLASNKSAGGLDLEICAEKYVTALNKFQKTRKNLRKITLVGITEESVQQVTSVFEKYLMPKKDNTKLQELHEKSVEAALEAGIQIQKTMLKALSAKKLRIDAINSDAIVIFVDENNKDETGFLTNIPAYEAYTRQLQDKTRSLYFGKKLQRYKSGHSPCHTVIHAVLSKNERKKDVVRKAIESVVEEATRASIARLTILLPEDDEDACVFMFSTIVAESFVDVCKKKMNYTLTEILIRVPGNNTQKLVAETIWDKTRLVSVV